jgi:hypothetical protein
MATATVTWRDIPPRDIVRLLGENGDGFHPRDICDPEWIHREFGIPLEVLPVEELVTGEDPVYLECDGKPVAYTQGVVAGHMISDIAKALGVARPAGARQGFSGGLFDLAAAIVKHLKAQ